MAIFKRVFTLTNLTLLTALALSSIAAWYSILGLTAIFSAAVIPVIIMGGALEIAKVVTTVWLHKFWDRAGWVLKLYLVPAVIALAFLTSMGIFGFLSKAHSDQSLVSGDVAAKIALFDEKIKISKENIDVNRKALKQLDEGVDQIMGRSTSEQGADKAVAIRRSQQKERGRLLQEIEAEQKKISQLNEQRAPIAAEVRKVEAEVGPIKYIAALIYGDNPDSNLLERAVRWVIILIVAVFDPLALTLVLSANSSRAWEKEKPEQPKYEPDDGPLTEDQIEQIKETVKEESVPEKEFDYKDHTYLFKPWKWSTSEKVGHQVYKEPEKEINEIPCFKCGTILVNAPGIGPFCPNKNCDVLDGPFLEETTTTTTTLEPTTTTTLAPEIITDDVTKIAPYRLSGEYALTEDKTIHINALKELKPELFLRSSGFDPNAPKTGFGTQFPKFANKGETFVRVDALPNRVFKFDGKRWIEISKTTTDSYLYNQEYIKHLIAKIDSGEYDVDLLSENEKQQIEDFLGKSST
jgi:hypothetical protein